jgi:D-cysteine desulfhydrase/L-cysteate sulfo-lyase
MAAAARKLGMKPSFVLVKDIHPETQGNLLLHNIMDSDVEILDVPHEAVFSKEISERLDQVSNGLRAKGYHPFVIRHALPDISVLLSSVGWVSAAREILQQLESQSINAQYLVLATATGGTQSGLILGSKYQKADYRILGVSAWKRKDEIESLIVERANAVSEFLKLGISVTPGDVEVNDEYIGSGYGILTKECLDAVKLVAKTEGIFLDPVYTGKAMAGLIDLIRKGRFTSNDTVVFIHSGGIPALFAYDKEVIR